MERPQFRVMYLKTFPDVLTGFVVPRCIHGVVPETKFLMANQQLCIIQVMCWLPQLFLFGNNIVVEVPSGSGSEEVG